MVLRRVDQPLRMLDAHAHSESLRLELDAAAVEHLVDVPGRMAGSQHDGRPFDERIAEQHALDTVLPDAQAGRTGPEDELAPGLLDRPADRRDDAGKAVGPDMRMSVVENRLVGAVKAKHLERLAVIAPLFGTGVQLAVGISPGPALAESVVAVGIDLAVAIDPSDVALTGRDVLAALEHDGPQPALDQPQCGEQPRRPRPDHHHGRPSPDERIVEPHRVGLPLMVDVHLDAQIDPDGTAPRVDRTPHDAHQRDARRIHPQVAGDQRKIVLHVRSLLRSENERKVERHIFNRITYQISPKLVHLFQNTPVGYEESGYHPDLQRTGQHPSDDRQSLLASRKIRPAWLSTTVRPTARRRSSGSGRKRIPNRCT